MFYSYESLVARNGKFALVWKLATSTNKKKLVGRSAILGVSVPEICDSLINMVPSGLGLKDELKSKFSLYLLSQLMYGVVIVLERQTAYLEIDIRAAYTATQNIHLNAPVEGEKHKVKKGIDGRIEEREKKGRKRRHEEDDIEYDIRNVPLDMSNLDMVGVALHNQITLQDPLPPPALINQYLPLEDDLLPPTHEELHAFQNIDLFSVVVERQSSSSSEEKFHRMEIEEPSPLIEKPFLSLELPPLEPFENLPPLPELGPEGDVSVQPPSAFIEPMEFEEIPRGKEASIHLGDKQTVPDILSLDATEVVLATPLSVKRRRPPMRMCDDVTMISWERVKENQRDYSSTLRSLEEIFVKPTDAPDINTLFKPYPTWMRRPLNKELRELYKPWIGQKMTYEEAAEIDPNLPPTRGPESKLWRYEGSSEEPSAQREFPLLDEDLRPTSGIGFIDSTPERAKEFEPFIQQDENEAVLPPLADLEDYEQRNQASDIEEVRRSTIGHVTADDEHRQSSLFLHPDDPTYGIAAFHQPGDSLIETTAHMERTKTIILSSLREAGGAHCSFNAMFPVDRTTRKQASCAFTGVLELVKSRAIVVQQDEPYGEIWIEAAKAKEPFYRRPSRVSAE